MRCLGSPQHLKTRFLNGAYNIDVHCEYTASEEEVNVVERYILEVALRGSVLEERHGRFLKFSLGNNNNNNNNNNNTTNNNNNKAENEAEAEAGGSKEAAGGGLSQIFANLQTAKSNDHLQIMDYSIMQASLEQVFISLAKQGDGAACAGREEEEEEEEDEGVVGGVGGVPEL
jgi:hypothetical protein